VRRAHIAILEKSWCGQSELETRPGGPTRRVVVAPQLLGDQEAIQVGILRATGIAA
jgi:hypothetical protein